jgi:hypothetical protein
MVQNRSDLIKLTHKSYFTNLLPRFLFIYNLTKHLKFNNIRFMSLTRVYDFLQVLCSKRRH